MNTASRRDGQHLDCASWLHKARPMPKEHFKKEVEKQGAVLEPAVGLNFLRTALRTGVVTLGNLLWAPRGPAAPSRDRWRWKTASP
jgi:hypothetical protein